MLWTTPKTLEIEWRNRLKELRIRSGLHSRKVELSRIYVKYFHAFVSTFNYVSPIDANNDKRRWSWDGAGLDRELSTCLTTSYKKLINSRQSGIFTTSVTGLCHAICYLFKKLKLFLHQLNSKSNGPVLLIKTLFWHDIVSFRLLHRIAKVENGLKLRPTTRYRTHTVISTR